MKLVCFRLVSGLDLRQSNGVYSDILYIHKRYGRRNIRIAVDTGGNRIFQAVRLVDVCCGIGGCGV